MVMEIMMMMMMMMMMTMMMMTMMMTMTMMIIITIVITHSSSEIWIGRCIRYPLSSNDGTSRDLKRG